jgi:Flp pilus assembly protein TadD
VAAGVVAVAATGWGLSRWLTPRTIEVCVVTDYSYRQQRPNWSQFLDARFAEANRMFRGTGVRWSFRHADQPDPTGRLQGMEERRQKLIRTECEADIILGVTGQPESSASGDAPAFAHTAMVVDDPKRPDVHNNRVFAQSLAALFGAPVDAQGAGTLMTQPPESDTMPKAAAKLISQLRDYDFASGTAALQGEWGDRIYQALVAAYTGRPGNAERAAHRAIGMSLAADQAFPAAIRHLSEVVKLDPKQAIAHVELAMMYSHNYQKAEAVAAYREAVRLEPDRAANRAGLAVALANALMGEEAIEEFNAALRLNPKFAVAQAGLAYLLSQQLGRIDEAIAAYRVAVEMNPGLPAAAQGLERAEGIKENSVAALPQHRQKAQQSPGSAGAHFDLGLAEARAGNVEPAVRAFRRVVELDAKNGRAHANLAMLLYLQKDYAGALRESEAAKRAGFDAPATLVELLKRKTGQ